MKRRTFLKNSSLTAFGVGAIGIMNSQGRVFGLSNLKVSEERIANRILELAKFGRNEKGQGYRVAYTKGDIEGRAWFSELMKKAGLEVSTDTGGNIIGKRKGKNPSLKPIAIGSHIDMVPDGGNYDGTLGSISALEVIEVLNDNKAITNHPLEVIIFGNEEGGTVGSKAMAGRITPEELKQVSPSGLTNGEGIRAIGGNPDDIQSCIRQKGDFHSFIELHIEQGGILELENIQVGVVTGIIGRMAWDITVEGVANHAGSTPMNLRQDALLAASKLVVAVNEVVTSTKGNHVGTIGKINAFPGAYNVIPGKATLGLEIRDLSFEKIEMLFAEIEKRAAIISKESKTKINFQKQAIVLNPAFTNKALQQTINTSAKGLGFRTRFMQSGPYHDSSQMSLIAPMAMIFVPSVGGISHSPKEFTKTVDMTNGANVLLQTILAVDKG